MKDATEEEWELHEDVILKMEVKDAMHLLFKLLKNHKIKYRRYRELRNKVIAHYLDEPFSSGNS